MLEFQIDIDAHFERKYSSSRLRPVKIQKYLTDPGRRNHATVLHNRDKNYFVVPRVFTFASREFFLVPCSPDIWRTERTPPTSKEGIHYPLAAGQGNRSTAGWRLRPGMRLCNYIRWYREILSAISVLFIFSSYLKILGSCSSDPLQSRSSKTPRSL